MPRIVILTVRHGAAHERVAQALRKALAEIRPDVTVDVEDMLAHCTRWFRAYYNSYELPLRYWPALWGWIEGRQHGGSSTGPTWLYRRGARPLWRWIKDRRPDIVVATETGILEIVSLVKREGGAEFRLVGVDGLDVDRAWAQAEVDLYAVAPDPVAAELAAAGVPASKIVPCGMPVDPSFLSLPSRSVARERLKIAGEAPLLLVLFGGAGFGKPREIIRELKKVRRPLQAVFITGKNRRLEDEARSLCQGDSRYRALGWADNMHEWMAAADMVLNKPSGLAIVEAMTCGLPFLALDPLPGNEVRHCGLIERWGVGCWVRRHADLAATLDRLLSNPGELDRMRERARELARPRAACEAAEAILQLVGSHQ
ncbi:MAG TPA: glycosyltransferase [Terriglobia bacterium]|nr:glycosyltransferase [Terriglobia bacterium]